MWVILLVILLFPLTRAAATSGADGKRTSLPSVQTDAVIDAVRVVIDAEPERRARYGAMAQQIISIQSGDRFSDVAINAAIKALELSRHFSAIHAGLVSDSGGETLVFTLTPYRHIKAIRVRGNYPLFERDILNQMTLYPGDPYTEADLSEQTETIVKRYQREGYLHPRVSVKAVLDPGDENAVVHVEVDKGPHYVLGRLTFDGNQGISSSALRWRMHVWRASLVPVIGRFSEHRLKKDMQSLLKYYRRRGFADAELTYDISDHDDRYRVDVTVRIDEGKRYQVDFEGNQHFWNLTLKKDVVIFQRGNRSNVGVRKSVRNMINRYLQAGYLDAHIDVQATDVPGNPVDIRRLHVVIEEGPQTIVDAVSVTGNRTIPEDEIRKQLLTRPPTLFHDGAFVPETLDQDTYAVTTLYMQQGFQERSVDAGVTFSEDKTAADVTLGIDEGPQAMVGTITIKGLTVLPESTVREVLKQNTGDPFRETVLAVDKEAIISLVSEQGYPHATVNTNVTYNDERTQADIAFEVDPGQLVTLGEIFISGNLRTKPKIIRRELEVQPQTPLSLLSLHDGQRQLRDLGIFHDVRYRTFGLKEQEETVNLFVEVEENKPYYAEVGGGYESDSGLFGRAAIGDRNLFGLNKDLWVGGEISQTGHRVEARLTEPRFLGTRTTASIGIFNEKLTEFNQPFGTLTTGGSLGFGRKWGDHLTTALTFSLENREQFSVDDQPANLLDGASRTIFVASPYLRYDNRDSFVRPTKGVFASLGMDISKGIDNELDDFVRYLFDTRYYFSPFEKITFAGLARVGQVFSYSENELVPDDQLFFLGGIQNVRGFKENLLRFDSIGDPVGGRTAVVGSLEARIDLGMNWELTTFFDVGSVRDALVDEGSDRMRASIGLGLRYITPIGPMGLLYGYKLDREGGESPGRIHLSIGYSF